MAYNKIRYICQYISLHTFQYDFHISFQSTNITRAISWAWVGGSTVMTPILYFDPNGSLFYASSRSD